MKIRFQTDADLNEDQRASLLKLTERYCVVYQTLLRPPHVNVAANWQPLAKPAMSD